MDQLESVARKVLILSASAGAGHVRAGDALYEVCRNHPRISEVQHWDMLKYTTRLFRHLYSQVYLDLIDRAPKMLGWIYDTTDTPWRNEKKRLAFEKFNARSFLRQATRFRPDIIVCTHFTPAGLVAWLYESGKIAVRPAIVITDLDVHAMWLVRSYQHYFVALDEARELLIRLGIDAGRISITGIPIDRGFCRPQDRHEARGLLGLQPELFTILVSAGGYGVGPVEEIIRELLRLRHPAQIVVIAGKGAALKSKVDAMAAVLPPERAVRLISVGFTDRMHDYMAAADILLGKPGGLTTSEAMARGLPMCIMNPIPGQEERNSDHLLERGVAIRCNNLPTLAFKIQKLIDHPDMLMEMRSKAQMLAHPDAAERIVEQLLAYPPIASLDAAGLKGARRSPRAVRRRIALRKMAEHS
jgi:processive 1,2-diacylglycerol beta-glucosyltransferase